MFTDVFPVKIHVFFINTGVWLKKHVILKTGFQYKKCIIIRQHNSIRGTDIPKRNVRLGRISAVFVRYKRIFMRVIHEFRFRSSIRRCVSRSVVVISILTFFSVNTRRFMRLHRIENRSEIHENRGNFSDTNGSPGPILNDICYFKYISVGRQIFLCTQNSFSDNKRSLEFLKRHTIT